MNGVKEPDMQAAIQEVRGLQRNNLKEESKDPLRGQPPAVIGFSPKKSKRKKAPKPRDAPGIPALRQQKVSQMLAARPAAAAAHVPPPSHAPREAAPAPPQLPGVEAPAAAAAPGGHPRALGSVAIGDWVVVQEYDNDNVDKVSYQIKRVRTAADGTLEFNFFQYQGDEIHRKRDYLAHVDRTG
jgi:hypothetical protein